MRWRDSSTYLGVLATNEVNSTIRIEPSEIPSLVETLDMRGSFRKALSPEGIVNEGLCCLFRATQIPASKDRPGYQELAHGAYWDEFIMIVKLHNPRKPTNTPADVGWVALGSQARIASRSDGALRWAVSCDIVSAMVRAT